MALRILEERRILLLKMLEEEAGKGWVRSAASKQERALELETHIGRVRGMLFAANDDKDLRGNQMAGV